jgi:tetratricopeptide (TPR) repeat protein
MVRVRRGPLQIIRLLAPTAVPRVLGWGSVALVGAAFLWWSPLSPVALWRADVMLGQGSPLGATEIYDAIAQSNPLPHLRAAALERSALTWSVELGMPQEARVRLEMLLHQNMTEPERADLLDRVGELLVLEGHTIEAARRLREAHDIAPEVPEAAERMMRAARAASAGGDLELAARLWRRLGDAHPEERARSELGLANVALSKGDVEVALQAFEAASEFAKALAMGGPELSSVASLGSATCLERLGELDEALAELDEADLPEEVIERRAARIRAREAIR